MNLFRIASSGLLAILSGTLVCGSVSRQLQAPRGEFVLVSLKEGDSSFQVLADKRCIGEITVSPKDETLIVRGKFVSVEAGELELSLGLVFNQLSQLSQALGIVRVKGEEIIRAEVKGVTPLAVTLRSSRGWPLPDIPSFPVVITKLVEKGRIQLIVRGLGPVAAAPAGQFTNLARNFELSSNSLTPCAYSPISVANIYR